MHNTSKDLPKALTRSFTDTPCSSGGRSLVMLSFLSTTLGGGGGSTEPDAAPPPCNTTGMGLHFSLLPLTPFPPDDLWPLSLGLSPREGAGSTFLEWRWSGVPSGLNTCHWPWDGAGGEAPLTINPLGGLGCGLKAPGAEKHAY